MTDPIADPDLVEHLDDDSLLLSLDAASDDDRPAFLLGGDRAAGSGSVTDESNRPGDTVSKPCIVEAFEGTVVVECGTAGTSLTPAVARDAGQRVLDEADRAEHDTPDAT